MRANKKGITNTARRAEVTIEFAFGIIASALVLMLILGVFNNNVKEMTKASRFQSLFGKNDGGTLANQTKYEQLANDPTQNIIAAAGAPMDLLAYRRQAIEGIKGILADGKVDSSELIDLGRLLTQLGTATTGSYGESSNVGALTSLGSLGIPAAGNLTLDTKLTSFLGESTGIYIDWDAGKTRVGNTEYNWGRGTGGPSSSGAETAVAGIQTAGW